MGLPDKSLFTMTVETPHSRTIPRSFAIATTETTVAEFARFKAGFRKWLDKNREEKDTTDPRRPEQGREPISYVTWYEAAAYCNWLSWKNSIPVDQWCYPPEIWKATYLVPDELLKDPKASPFPLTPGLQEKLVFTNDPFGSFGEDHSQVDKLGMPGGYLERTGYRLPTEAEWEYACRAGAAAEAIRFFGRDESLLGDYAKYQPNTPDSRFAPVGTFLPNLFGLFDMLGNVAEWCQYWLDYPHDAGAGTLVDRDPGPATFKDLRLPRILRGGSHFERAEVVRCSYRQENNPFERRSEMGFRVARTLPGQGRRDTH